MATYTLGDFLKHTSELATISPAAVELINKINIPSTRRDEIARLVSTDEVLFMNVFKYTNSAAFGLTTKPRNINEAINILGINTVRSLVFAVAAKKVFVDHELWYTSVFTAIAAQKIATKLNLEQNIISNIYIAGLMQSMGTLVFKTFYAKEYKEIISITDHKERAEAEEAIFNINNCELSYAIVKDYGLPEMIIDIIETQGYDYKAENYKLENVILDLALSLSEIPKDEIENQATIDKAMNLEMLSKFKINSLDINPEFLQQLHSEADNFVNF